MSLIKKIKQFINGSWQEFQLDANNIDNVATREWVTNADKTIVGDTTLNGDIILAGGEIRLTDDVYLDGSEIYYNGQYVGDFHPNAPYAYANKQWVESLVTNQVQYLGIVNSIDDIRDSFIPDNAVGKAGDFVRAGSSFTIETETVHPGDIIIANNVTPSISLANYDIVHTEDPGNYVTLATDQTITGKKTFDAESTFNSFVFIKNYDGSLTTSLDGMSLVLPKANGDNLVISASSIMIDDTASSRENGESPKFPTIKFPTKSGTIATLGDIPTNYVTTDTDQMISGGKTFNIHTNMDSTDRTRFEVHHTAEIGMGLFDYTFACGAYWPSIQGNGKSMYISSTGFQRDDDAGSSTWFTLPTESLDPATHDLTLATRGWVKANTICSSTIDQEFFNSLY